MLLTLFAPPPIAQQSAPGALLLLLSGANATIGPAIGSVVARLSIRPAVDANLRTMAIDIIYLRNDNLLELNGLRDEVSGAFLNAATVSVTLLDATGTAVTGATWPMALTHVAGSRGVYRVTLGHALPLAANARYVAQIVVDGGAGLYASWSLDVVARTRK